MLSSDSGMQIACESTDTVNGQCLAKSQISQLSYLGGKILKRPRIIAQDNNTSRFSISHILTASAELSGFGEKNLPRAAHPNLQDLEIRPD
jgi:hypothetical protein